MSTDSDRSEPGDTDSGSAPSDERPFRDVAAHLPIPCWISDAAGDLIWVNDAWTTFTGLDIADIRKRGLAAIHDPSVLDSVARRWREIVARGEPSQMIFPMRARDGVFKPFLTRVAPMHGPGGKIDRWLGAHADLTEITMATDQLLLQNRTLSDQVGEAFARARGAEMLRQRFWDTSRDLLAVVPTGTGIPSLMNGHAWTRTLGYPPEHLSTVRMADLVHPDDLQASIEQRAILARGGSIHGFENRYRAANGEWVWLSWNIRSENDIHYCIARDVTQEKEARARLAASERQLRETQVKLAHAQKMEAIGRLTGGVAHDFNNLLAVVAGGIKLLRRAPERADAIIESMQEAVDRGARLTTQLLGFARKQETAPEVIRPAETIRAMRELLRRSIGEDIQIDILAPDTSWTVEVDPGQLELVVLNLAVNARDAMSGGGQLRIEIINTRNADGADMVRVTASDTGTGIAPELIERAFEPFFTTKDFGKGSGLGLAQVYGFAQQAGGRAWLENNEGGGLSVHFELPRSSHAAAAKKPAAGPAPADARPAGGGRVLLVEDDAAVAGMAHQILLQAGFACHHAVSASEALAALESETFDVVFSDIVMPGGMNGVELARTIRTRWPRLPVVLATGYSAKAELTPGEFTVFQKPYDADKLISALKASAAAAAG